ncbi:MAG: hypothetical protein OEV66_03020 [Spirochaetia bacterium]|nr:hypothetical protein [Spirochaetia bacterium]
MKASKLKIAAAIIEYLTETKSSPNSNSRKPSAEEKLMGQILRDNHEAIKLTPPEHILHFLQLKQSVEPVLFSRFQNIFMHLKPSLIAPVIVIIVSIFIVWKPRERKIPLSFAAIGQEFARIPTEYILEKSGIRISVARTGEIAIENKGLKDHIFLKQGSWQISASHQLFKKETWFHFPGGGIKPLGTNLSIDIENDGTKVNLKKGKIQTYFVNKFHRLEKSTIETAPYAHEFPAGVDLVSFPEGDGLTSQADEIVKYSEADQIDKLAEENSSVYQNFIGATISVIHGNGSVISGVLEYVYGGKLNIKTKSGLVEVIGNNMLLVSLDATRLPSSQNSFFRETK